MNIELNKEEQAKAEAELKAETLVDGPQCFVICHCCGAVVFVPDELMDQLINERRETKEETPPIVMPNFELMASTLGISVEELKKNLEETNYDIQNSELKTNNS